MQISLQRISGNHAIERIFVNRRQRAGAIQRCALQRQNFDVLQPQLLFYPAVRLLGQGQLAAVVFQGDFPDASEAERAVVVLAVESLRCRTAQFFRRAAQPNKCARIEEQGHGLERS